MKKFLVIFIILVAIGLIGVLVFPQIFIKLAYQLKFSKPSAYYQLVNRSMIANPMKSNGMGYQFYTVSFNVPWRAEADRTEKDRYLRLVFSNGKSVILMTNPISVVKEMKDTESKNIEKIEKFFGENTLTSDYDFYRTALQQTPDTWSILTPPREAVAKFATLSIKTSLITASGATEGPVYEFNTGKVRGFLFQPSEKQKRIAEIFAIKNDAHYTLILEGVDEEETDYIINSLEELDVPTSD